MHGQILNDLPWTCRLLRASDDAPADFPWTPIPSLWPECIHSVLIRAGLIQHPNLADNESRTQWVGRSDWQYRCEFTLEAQTLEFERIDLVFDHLDTIATITLNGNHVGRAANQFHPHRFDVRHALREGTNELTVDLKSPIEHIRAEKTRLGARPVNGDWDPYVFMRKSACNFGWDWGPRVATVEVRGVLIEAWNAAYISEVRPLVFPEVDGGWRVEAHVAIESASDQALDLRMIATIRDGDRTLACGETRVFGNKSALITLFVNNVTPWMPRGYGEARLYRLKVELHDPVRLAIPPRTALSIAHRRIGFRTISLDTTPDEHGSRFTVRVNDKPIFVLGANWIPEDLFPEDRGLMKIRKRLRQAADANLNLLRVWGGGAYEIEGFYRACDELGILVWQDFMFACACYPEEEPIRSQVEAEARYQIARLSSHPSVALWCGGNECIWAHQGWGFDKRLQPGQTWGRTYWLDLLPRLCAELDPTRPYWPNTPWSGDESHDVQDPNHGTRHTWDKTVEGYRDLVPRFIAEFGHQSPPNYTTIHESLGNQPIESWLRDRQRASGGNAVRYDEPLAEHFAPARDFDEWLYQAHLLQARAIALGFEWARIHRDRCGGAIFWQLNDAWAGHSWSAIDVAGRLKPLWYAVRRACAPRMLTIQPLDGRPRLYAVNDTQDIWRATVLAWRVRFDGTILAKAEIPITIPPQQVAAAIDLAALLGPPVDPARECIVVDPPSLESSRATWFHHRDRDLALDPPRLSVGLHAHATETHINVTAQSFARDLVIAIDRVIPDARVDQQLVTLLPGESATFVITGPPLPQPDALYDALESTRALRCANGPAVLTRK